MEIRVIPQMEGPAPLQMAIDWLLFSKEELAIRFYRMEGVWVTLGKNQRQTPPPFREFPAAQRPTGGKAVLHRDDLVMCLVSPYTRGPFKGGVIESYRRVAEALVGAARGLGLRLELVRGKPKALSELCFEVASIYEITLGGKKVVGMAQYRAGGKFLLQASLQGPAANPGLEPLFIRELEALGLVPRLRPLAPRELETAKDLAGRFKV